MNTAHLIQQAGLWPTLCLLLIVLLVAVLRLLALPLAAAALALDAIANAVSTPLSLTRPGGPQ